MPKLRGKVSAKKLRKLKKEYWAREPSDDKRHDITAEPVSVTVL